MAMDRTVDRMLDAMASAPKVAIKHKAAAATAIFLSMPFPESACEVQVDGKRVVVIYDERLTSRKAV